MNADRIAAIAAKLPGMDNVALADAVRMERAATNYAAADLYAAELAKRETRQREWYSVNMAKVTEAVQELGFERISPESLGALGDELAAGNYTHVRGAYNVTMHGFRQLLGAK